MTEDTDGLLLGRMAVERGLITEERLRDALEVQRREEIRRPLGRILVEKGFLTDLQLTALLAAQRMARGDTTLSAARESDPKTSTVFQTRPFGKYTLLKRLGTGGMGVVFEALDPVLNRRVAIKTLIPASYPSSEEAMRDEERFLREAQLAAGLEKHPHVVGVYEAGIIDGKRYLAMEFVDGVQLNEWRKTRPFARQLRLLRDVALAVHHAHESGVVHRDLKPANVLVDGKDMPHITDFGLAKSRGKELTGALTDPGIAIGTPAYMSPEQAQGLRSVDRRSDVYSLGVLLYEILTDRLPFLAETQIQMLVQIIEHPVPPPSSVVGAGDHPARDAALESICMKALAKAPAARYQTAQDLADDLTRWIERGSAPLLKPAPAAPPPPPAPAPRRGAYALFAALLVAAVAVAIFRAPPTSPAVVEKKEDIRVFDLPDRVNAVGFSPKGDRIAAGCANGTVKIWEMSTGKEAATLGVDGGKVEGLAFSPDGRTLAVVTEDPEEGGGKKGEVMLWNVERRERKNLEGHAAGVNAVAFSPDGSLLLTGDQQACLKAWDLKTLKPLASTAAHAQALRGIAFAPDGRTFVTASWDNTLKLWSREGFAVQATFEGHQEGVWGVAYSPKGDLVASASSDKTVKLWEVGARRELKTLKGHQSVVQSVAFSPCGKRLVSASRDRTLKVWDVEKGVEVDTLRGHGDTVWTVAWSPDGKRVASGAFDRKLALWPMTPPVK